MDHKSIPPNTRVIAGFTLGTVARRIKRYRTDGYDVQLDGGMYTNHYGLGQVSPAVVGDNVCEHPRGHGCGLFHVDAETLSRLPRVSS